MGDFDRMYGGMSAAESASVFGAGALGRRGGGYYGPENNSSYNRAPRNPVSLGIQQHEVVRGQTRTLGNRKRSLRKLAKLAEQYQKTIWSQITPNWGSAATLKKPLAYVTVESGVNTFPMYAWNLSDLPVGYIGTTLKYNVPHYQLFQTAATGDYFWTAQSGNSSMGTDVPGAIYTADPYTYGVLDAASTPGKQPRWIHDYSSVSVIFQGATTRQTTNHVMVCEFSDPGVGPRRQVSGGAYADDDAPADVQAGSNNFWDKFWSKKVNNPIYKANIMSDGTRHMRVIARDTVRIGPEATYNEDVRGRTVQKKYYYKFGQIHSGVSEVGLQSYDRTNFVGTGQPFQTDVVGQYGLRNASNLSGSYGKTRWLVVYADVSTLSYTAALNSSFDIVVTNKHTVVN